MAKVLNQPGQSLNVLIMTPLGPGGKGGIDRLMDAVRSEIHRSPIENVSVSFLITRGQRSTLAPFIFFLSLLKLLIIAAGSKCDVAHINLSADGSTWRKSLLALLCRLLRIPYVLHLHSGRYHTFWSSQRPVLRRYINRMFEGATAVVVLGSIWADLICKNTPSVSERILILPNATASPPAKAIKPDHVAKSVHVLFLGRLGENKGIPELLQAFGGLSNANPWHATLAGDGDVEETRRSILSLGLNERVSAPGWINAFETEEVLRAADILVLPSRGENLPMSIVEAFAHGLAVIATPVGAIPEIVEHERTGLLVPVGDVPALQAALSLVIEDADLRNRLGKAAKEHHHRELELSCYVTRLGKIWRQVAQNGAPVLGAHKDRDVPRKHLPARPHDDKVGSIS
jgi:glycosyltransferase involved in cell wall biosynthesis